MIHVDAKLNAREALAGDRRGPHQGRRAGQSRPLPECFSPARFKGASPRLIGMTWGPEDLSAEIGAEANRDQHGRSTGALPARALALPVRRGRCRNRRRSKRSMSTSAISTACGARRKQRAATALSGELAIHPAQVPMINEVFTPTAGGAREGTSDRCGICRAPGAGAIGIDGVMYDRPHLARATQLLTRATAQPDSVWVNLPRLRPFLVRRAGRWVWPAPALRILFRRLFLRDISRRRTASEQIPCVSSSSVTGESARSMIFAGDASRA